MDNSISNAITRLEQLRQHRVLLYIGEDRLPGKGIDEDDIPMLYTVLRDLPHTEQLDVVLHQFTGRVNIARKLALLLRNYTDVLHMLIPYKARSSATLLALVANSIVMTPLAELGPLDPQIAASGEPPPGTPALMSIEDIRAFRKMAEAWFALPPAEGSLQLVSLLSQRMFPATLGNFFRAEQQMYQIAEELLQFQLPEAQSEVRHQIAQQLISGYYAHDYVITATEAQQIGLQVSLTTPAEEQQLWDTLLACRQLFREPGAFGIPQDATIDGIIATTSMLAIHIVHWNTISPSPNAAGRPMTGGRFSSEAYWQIV